MKKTIIRFSLLTVLLLLAYLSVVLIHGTLNDWQPEARTELSNDGAEGLPVITDSVLTFLTWNLGYGGLGEESEFFYDRGSMLFSWGHMVRSPQAAVDKNNEGIRTQTGASKVDFFLYQEVDYGSKRSFFTNQHEAVQQQLPDYAAFFAPNYRAKRVPIPIFEPWRAYGAVESGLGTYSKYQPYESLRLQLPGEFPWPTRIFQLDRCLSLHRFRVEGEKVLTVINLHNSAYDADGSLKQAQMAFLQQLLLDEYEKGHYIIVGGDWNQVPPYFRFDGFMPGRTQGYTQSSISPDFLPADWQWGYDPRVPTNRKTKTPYEAGETFITLIDFFLVSPNVRIRSLKGMDQQFRFSDHQPVYMEVELL